MLGKFKKLFYFPIAYYFRFFAKIQLLFWKPRIILVTGSTGKTTLLHLIASQLGEKALYSYKANSSYGIPFNILGLERKNLLLYEWFYLFLSAPFKAFRKSRAEKLYIVEADCDRVGEGKFLAKLLRPEVTIWQSIARAHTVNFDKEVLNKKFRSVEEAIAHEFGYFLKYTNKLVIINGDSSLIKRQAEKIKAQAKIITKKQLEEYKIFKDSARFKISGENYSVKALLPKDTFYSIAATRLLANYLNLPFDSSFRKFNLPNGRNSLLRGTKQTAIIDSSYNATPDGVRATLEMFNDYQGDKKWVVLGDMIELGNEEKEEHEKLAKILNSMKFNKIILIGPRVSKYTHPKLVKTALQFIMPKDALNYLETNIRGKEIILFKGARFLEGIIEHLLLNKNDSNKLVRREKVWRIRRKQWGL